jgi:hypothetical protein
MLTDALPAKINTPREASARRADGAAARKFIRLPPGAGVARSLAGDNLSPTLTI